MEAIERYSSTFVGDEHLVRARICEVDGIAPNTIALNSEQQLRDYQRWNARPGEIHRIPEPFDADTPTDWIPAASLHGGPVRHLPAGNVFLAYPFAGQRRYANIDTNGCAAGCTLRDATLRALLELIERDALAIWWYNRLKRPAVDLDAWADRGAVRLRSLLKRHRRGLELLDLTHDLGIPIYAAVSADHSGKSVHVGCGAGLCGAMAARRAMAELAQFWYWGSRIGPSIDQRLWLAKSSLAMHSYLSPANWSAPVPGVVRLTGGEALRQCLAAVQSAGLEAFRVVLTRPEIGVPVVRVVVPCLRHHGPHFAAGRIFDVPIHMGWRKERCAETELNPDDCVL